MIKLRGAVYGHVIACKNPYPQYFWFCIDANNHVYGLLKFLPTLPMYSTVSPLSSHPSYISTHVLKEPAVGCTHIHSRVNSLLAIWLIICTANEE